jgi:hypothetical protein
MAAHLLPVDASIVTGGNKQAELGILALVLAFFSVLDLALNLGF